MGYSIVAITNEWDIFRRRYRSLFSELIKFKNIEYILFVQPPLTLYSFFRFIFGKMNRRDSGLWKRILKKGFIYREGKIIIITPIVLFPFISVKPLLLFNIFCLNKFRIYSVRYLIKKLGLRDLILWINHPYHSACLVNQFPHKLFCYDLCDDYNTKEKDETSLTAMIIKKNDNYLTENADIMFVTSDKLFQDRSKITSNIYRIPNGVNLELFNRVNDQYMNDDPVSLGNIPRPTLLYIGNISSHVDMELIRLITKTHPEWSLVLIGPLKRWSGNSYLINNRSIYLLGSKPYDETISYLKYCDVSIIPYLKSPWTISADTIKIYNSIASGKPVVSTEVGSAKDFSDVVYIGKDNNDFVQKIELALNETEEARERREKMQYEIIAEHTWQKRAERIHNLMMAQL